MPEKILEIGAFYWVVIALDTDTDNEWENRPMPARYEGHEGFEEESGVDRWTYLGLEGPSDWPVRWVGEKLLPPAEKTP